MGYFLAILLSFFAVLEAQAQVFSGGGVNKAINTEALNNLRAKNISEELKLVEQRLQALVATAQTTADDVTKKLEEANEKVTYLSDQNELLKERLIEYCSSTGGTKAQCDILEIDGKPCSAKTVSIGSYYYCNASVPEARSGTTVKAECFSTRGGEGWTTQNFSCNDGTFAKLGSPGFDGDRPACAAASGLRFFVDGEGEWYTTGSVAASNGTSATTCTHGGVSKSCTLSCDRYAVPVPKWGMYYIQK